MMRIETTDVLIIGAGPAGSVAAGFLRKQGRNVIIIEKEAFPRFSIGESLLPQCMEFIEAAGFLQDVIEAGFQYKNGASFQHQTRSTSFDFREKFSTGWGTTYQVPRANFDALLAKSAEKSGATVRYLEQVVAVNVDSDKAVATIKPHQADRYQIQAQFLLDASGFGRVLPRLLDLEIPSNFPVRSACFTHIEDRLSFNDFDRNKILITVHPKYVDVWFWLIPFSNGRSSIGVVASQNFLQQYSSDPKERLSQLITETPTLANLLHHASWDTQVRELSGYACNVKSLYGPCFALLGNAAEFLDPVFSSGVTIALKSASLAASAIGESFSGKNVDWEKAYAIPLKVGIDTFRVFVESWYAGDFQNIIFHEDASADIRKMICSILAGYAWDTSNPYVNEPKRLKTLEQLCAP